MTLARQHAATAASALAPLPEKKLDRRFGKKPKPLRVVAPGLTMELGIQRFEVIRERTTVLGAQVQRELRVSLSGGDGADFSAWWTVTCQPASKRGRCLSPDGCTNVRLKGRSYCRAHLTRYTTMRPLPTGRLFLVPSAAPQRKQKPKPKAHRLTLQSAKSDL